MPTTTYGPTTTAVATSFNSSATTSHSSKRLHSGHACTSSEATPSRSLGAPRISTSMEWSRCATGLSTSLATIFAASTASHRPSCAPSASMARRAPSSLPCPKMSPVVVGAAVRCGGRSSSAHGPGALQGF
jgi:hypothetical protein